MSEPRSRSVARLWYGMPAYAKDGKVIRFSSPPLGATRARRDIHELAGYL
jgi:hypothetical protein